MITIPLNQNAQIMQVFDANSTLGAIEIGVLISLFLFGLVTAQVCFYINRFPRDPWILKTLVTIVWFLELGHTISVCHALYVITVSQYGQPQLLVIPPLSLDAAILFSGFVGPIEQCWFAYRVYRFSGRLFIPICCTFLAFSRWLGSTTLAIVAFHQLTIEDYTEHWSWLITAIIIVGACGDVILALSLCFYLNKWKGSRFQRTSILIKRLMLWTTETGLLTSIGAVALLVCYLTMKHNFVWIGIFTILARLFSNSFLASLNTRPVLAQLYDQDIQVSVLMGTPPVSQNRQHTLELADVPPIRSVMRTLPSAVGKNQYHDNFFETCRVVGSMIDDVEKTRDHSTQSCMT